MISHFSFWRGKKQFEVFVDTEWNEKNISSTRQTLSQATPLFLEEDDFSFGHEIFSLDFLLMQKTGAHISGKNILTDISITNEKLRHNIEGEVRRLATKIRTSFFFSERIPTNDVLVTLHGIAIGLEELGCKNPLSEETVGGLKKIKNTFFPKEKINILLALLQKWEDYLENAK